MSRKRTLPVTELERLRREKGLSDDYVAARAKIERHTYRTIEQNIRAATSEEQKAIAHVFGVKPRALFVKPRDCVLVGPPVKGGNVKSRVLEARHAQGMTQLELSAKTGIKKDRLADIEQEEAAPLLEEALCLAQCLGTTVEELFERRRHGLVDYEDGRESADLIGMRFGKLLVIDRVSGGINVQRHRRWLCRCDCGRICEVRGDYLRSGHTQSCGCNRRRALKTKEEDRCLLTESR